MNDANSVVIGDLKMDFDNKKITIHGSGEIPEGSVDSYFASTTKCRRCSSKTEITSVEIQDQVTIGSKAFFGCSNLATVVAPETITRIPDSAFMMTSIQSLDFVPNLQNVGPSAFEGCKLTSISLSKDVFMIESRAFANNGGLVEVSYCGLTDPAQGVDQFVGASASLTLKVLQTVAGDDRKYDKETFCGIDVTESHRVLAADTCGIPKGFSPPSKYFSPSFMFSPSADFEPLELNNVVCEASICWAFMYKENHEVVIGFNFTYQMNSDFFRLSHFSNTESEAAKYGTATVPDHHLINFQGKITVPSSFTIGSETFSVTGIRQFAFENYEFNQISLPDTVKSLGEGCFQNCARLTSIDIPACVTTIGAACFRSCSAISQFSFPIGTSVVAPYVLYDCKVLAQIELRGNVTSVGAFSMANCPAFTQLSYCGLTEINFDATWHQGSKGGKFRPVFGFPGTFDLHDSSVTIFEGINLYTKTGVAYNIFQFTFRVYPSSDTASINSADLSVLLNLDDNCFRCKGPQNLKEFHIYNKFDKPIDISASAFKDCTGLEVITLGEHLTSIGDSSLVNTKIKNIVIPNSCISIGSYAFDGVSTLESVNLGEGVRTLGNFAFRGTGITKIVIPKSIASIGESSFDGIISLTEVQIKGDVTIGAGCFNGCSGLTSITYCGKKDPGRSSFFSDPPPSVTIHVLTTVTFADFGGLSLTKDANIVSKNNLKMTFEDQNLTIIADESQTSNPVGKTEVNDAISTDGKCISCLYAEVKHLRINGGLYKIVSEGLSQMTNLLSLNLDGRAEIIDSQAFSSCSSLTAVKIRAYIQKFGNYVFHDCIALTDFYYCHSNQPASDISEFMFFTSGTADSSHGTYALQVKVYTPTTFEGAKFKDECEAIKTANVFMYNDAWFAYEGSVLKVSGTGLVTAERVIESSMSSEKCLKCLGKTKITFASVESPCTISPSVFEGCTSLASVALPAECSTIPASAFKNSGLATFPYVPNIESIGESSFENTRLANVLLSQKVTSISSRAFASCSLLTNLSYCGIRDPSIGTSQFDGSTNLRIHLIKDLSSHRYISDSFCGISLNSLDQDLDSDICGIPTYLFTYSAEFSYTNDFQATNMFPLSKDFSDSNDFKLTSLFTHSARYSESDEFLKSDMFSVSKHFANSFQFSESTYLSPSLNFERSNIFSKSSGFEESHPFSMSQIFQGSADFAQTRKFSQSTDFMMSLKFVESSLFTLSQTVIKDENPQKLSTGAENHVTSRPNEIIESSEIIIKSSSTNIEKDDFVFSSLIEEVDPLKPKPSSIDETTPSAFHSNKESTHVSNIMTDSYEKKYSSSFIIMKESSNEKPDDNPLMSPDKQSTENLATNTRANDDNEVLSSGLNKQEDFSSPDVKDEQLSSLKRENSEYMHIMSEKLVVVPTSVDFVKSQPNPQTKSLSLESSHHIENKQTNIKEISSANSNEHKTMIYMEPNNETPTKDITTNTLQINLPDPNSQNLINNVISSERYHQTIEKTGEAHLFSNQNNSIEHSILISKFEEETISSSPTAKKKEDLLSLTLVVNFDVTNSEAKHTEINPTKKSGAPIITDVNERQIIKNSELITLELKKETNEKTIVISKQNNVKQSPENTVSSSHIKNILTSIKHPTKDNEKTITASHYRKTDEHLASTIKKNDPTQTQSKEKINPLITSKHGISMKQSDFDNQTTYHMFHNSYDKNDDDNQGSESGSSKGGQIAGIVIGVIIVVIIVLLAIYFLMRRRRKSYSSTSLSFGDEFGGSVETNSSIGTAAEVTMSVGDFIPTDDNQIENMEIPGSNFGDDNEYDAYEEIGFPDV